MQDIIAERTLIAEGLTIVEGPRWHDGSLWFSDFCLQKVMRVEPDGRLSEVAHVPGQPSGLGWLPDGRLLVVSMHDRRVLRLDAQGLALHADLSALATCHCNDMLVDGQGRAYVGNFGFDMFEKEPERPAEIILVEPDGSARIVASDMRFPNGTVVTRDGRTLVVAETFGKRLSAFDVAPDGTLSNRRVWAAFDEAMPDGICIDAEDAIWVASPPTREYLRVREGGEITHRIAIPGQAIACALGGEDGHTLYLTSGKLPRPLKALAERQGRIESLRVDVPAAR
ncbi:SMP-30/gluconolactonase/LRE family protein [Noviherbaspirillum galbum]|uniref:SMP-30/gluconolactonase/LRE family protein n=1 Tax=Noviherbaspirillum galbum TaxID=2709383 RepID=A0A6B3SRZ7_9BURK|nr:SMP-30/gluconolactonase/LRE family protein [Noviherbaspirillum galbum]NEX63464.1 SMP-30/gluconolactonase/LRE family protein [Noviherbaspirillum galbum]